MLLKFLNIFHFQSKKKKRHNIKEDQRRILQITRLIKATLRYIILDSLNSFIRNNIIKFFLKITPNSSSIQFNLNSVTKGI